MGPWGWPGAVPAYSGASPTRLGKRRTHMVRETLVQSALGAQYLLEPPSRLTGIVLCGYRMMRSFIRPSASFRSSCTACNSRIMPCKVSVSANGSTGVAAPSLLASHDKTARLF